MYHCITMFLILGIEYVIIYQSGDNTIFFFIKKLIIQ